MMEGRDKALSVLTEDQIVIREFKGEKRQYWIYNPDLKTFRSLEYPEKVSIFLY